VNQGDTILLSLSFSNGNVIMQGTDQTTGAHAQVSYTAASATTFIGSSPAPGNSNGFFTGLMTEWYHTTPYYGGEQKVTYTVNGSAITSAWLWIDEGSVSPSGTRKVLFNSYTSSPITFTNPTQFQSFVSNGATESENTTQFTTGQIPTVSLTFGYSVTGGTGTLPEPGLTYISAGVKQTATLTQSNQAFIVDVGSSWSITNPLTSSTSTERCQTNQPTTGTVGSPQTIDFTFYHQYLVTFDFNIIGGGIAYSPPSATCQQFGSQITAVAGTQIWADAGQYSFPNLLDGSSSSERWVTNSTSGMVISSGNIDTEYFHQYITTVSYSIIDGGTPGASVFTSTSLNLPLSQILTTQPEGLWVDSGASYSFTNLLPESTSTERWQPTAPLTGSIISSSTINIPYYHQYYITITLNPTTGGSVSAADDWYNAGTSFQVIASPNAGWQFENWSGSGLGSYSGDKSSALAAAVFPLTETATFYPGLTITASGKLSVSYVYGTTFGLIPSSTPDTIYAASGTNIQLTAKPKLFIYSFAGWTGSVTDNKNDIFTELDVPQNINANFSYNYLNIGIIFAGVIAAIIAVVFLVVLKRR